MFEFARFAATAALVGCALAGCASVTDGATQPIAVSTIPESGAICVLSNARGTWTVVTPGTATIEKSVTVVKVVCSKSGWQNALAYLTPGVPTAAQIGMMLPYVGIVSAAVDGSTGAANKYPESVVISMKAAVQADPAPAGISFQPGK